MKVLGFPLILPLTMLTCFTAVLDGAEGGVEEVNQADPGSIAAPIMFRPNESDLTIDEWRPGTYSLKAFIRPHSMRNARITAHSLLAGAEPRPNLRLVVDPSNHGRFTIPLQAFGIDKYCCADNFDELQIVFRDLNPNNRVQIGVNAVYDSPVALGDNVRSDESRRTVVATSGLPDQAPRTFNRALQVTELRWLNRDLFYPIRRLLGLADSGSVYLTSLQAKTVAQFRPDLDLGSSRFLQFELGNCAALDDLHVRVGFRNTSALVTGVQATGATTTSTGRGSLLAFNIAQARETLGLKSDENIRITEIFAHFASSKEAVAACRPLKSIRYETSTSRDRQIESLVLPYEITSGENGLRIFRVRQSALTDLGKWGRLLEKLAIHLKEADPRLLSGIELLNVRYGSPAEGALPVSRPSGCINPVSAMAVVSDAVGDGCADEMLRVNFAAMSVARLSTPASKMGVTFDVRGEGATYRLGAASLGLHAELLLPNAASGTMRFDLLGASDMVRKVSVVLYFSDTITASDANNPDRLLRNGENEIIIAPGEVLTLLFKPNSLHFPQSLAFMTLDRVIETSFGPQRTKIRRVSWRRDDAEILTEEDELTPGASRRVQNASYLRYAAPGSEVCYGFSGARVCAPGNLDAAEIVNSDGLHLKGENSRWIRFEWDGTLQPAKASAIVLAASSASSASPLSLMIDSAALQWRDAADVRHEIPLALNALVPLPTDRTELKDMKILFQMRPGAFDFYMSELRILNLRRDGSGDPINQKAAINVQKGLRFGQVENAVGSAQTLSRGDQVIFFRNDTGWGRAVSLQWTAPLNVRRSELVKMSVFFTWPSALMQTGHVVELVVRGREHTVTLPLRVRPAQQYYSLLSSALFPADFPLDEELVSVEVRIAPNEEFHSFFGSWFGQFSVRADIRAVAAVGEGMPNLPLLEVENREIEMPGLSIDQLRTLLTRGGWIDIGTWDSGSGQTVRRLQHPIFEVDGIRLDPMK